jgi:hypothetical protein
MKNIILAGIMLLASTAFSQPNSKTKWKLS